MVMRPSRQLAVAFIVRTCGTPTTRWNGIQILDVTNRPGNRTAPSQVKTFLLPP